MPETRRTERHAAHGAAHQSRQPAADGHGLLTSMDDIRIREQLSAACCGPMPTRSDALPCNPACEITTSAQPITNVSLRPLVMRSIPITGLPVGVRTRALPFEAPPSLGDAALLREYDETVGFLKKQLVKDPRAKPESYVVELEHMESCVMCEHDRRLRESMHGVAAIDGARRQLLFDDHAIESWLNLVRFLKAPVRKEVAVRGKPGDTRLGCPCSAHPTGAGGVRLWHAAGGFRNRTWRARDDEHAILSRWSANGLDGWTPPERVTIDGMDRLKTFVVAQPVSPSDGGGEVAAAAPDAIYYAGYEGRIGLACLATSTDGGRSFKTLAPRGGNKPTLECGSRTRSYLGRAADSYVTPLLGRRRDVVWYRKDFGTASGWREIRGVHVAELTRNFSLAGIRSSRASPVRRMHDGFYLDRLGKLERFRRQLYSVQLTPYEGFYLGLATVLEWPKDDSEPQNRSNPAFERDTTNVYLVTSRDGLHIDDGWIYAHRPLIPKGRRQADWDAGFLLPAAQIVTDETTHRIYFEARSGSVHHEKRFSRPAVLGVATWPRDRLVGVRQALGSRPGVMETKRISVRGTNARLWVEFECAAEAPALPAVAVEILEGSVGNETKRGFSAAESVLVQRPHGGGGRGGAVEVRWHANESSSRPHQHGDRIRVRRLHDALPALKDPTGTGAKKMQGATAELRLRFIVQAGAELYSFHVRP